MELSRFISFVFVYLSPEIIHLFSSGLCIGMGCMKNGWVMILSPDKLVFDTESSDSIFLATNAQREKGKGILSHSPILQQIEKICYEKNI